MHHPLSGRKHRAQTGMGQAGGEKEKKAIETQKTTIDSGDQDLMQKS